MAQQASAQIIVGQLGNSGHAALLCHENFNVLLVFRCQPNLHLHLFATSRH